MPARQRGTVVKRGSTWQVLWSSEYPRYGGTGALPVINENGWLLIGKSAVVLADFPE